MAQIESFIENSMKKIKNLKDELHQETDNLNFLRCCKKDLDEAEKIQNENSIKISELNSKIAWYERKLKSRDSLLTKMDTEMNQLKMKSAAKISDLNSTISTYELELKSRDLSLTKLNTEMNLIQMKNTTIKQRYKDIMVRFKEELDATNEAHKQDSLRVQKSFERLLRQRDDNRALYNYTRYTITSSFDKAHKLRVIIIYFKTKV